MQYLKTIVTKYGAQKKITGLFVKTKKEITSATLVKAGHLHLPKMDPELLSCAFFWCCERMLTCKTRTCLL